MTKDEGVVRRDRPIRRSAPVAALFPAAGLCLLLFPWTARPARPQGDDARPTAGSITLSARERAEVLKGRIILREVPEPGRKGKTSEAVGVLPGSLDDALAIVTDYRRYPDFMPRVSKTVVTDESETASIVDLYLNLPLGMDKRYRLRYRFEKGPDGFRVDWEKIPWPEVPPGRTVVDTSGHWQVERFDAGGLLALYNVYTDPGRVPLGMTGLARSLSKREVPKVIERVRERLRALLASRPVKS
jgi:Polyketide cyclase / dehydrase and lipid transport